MTTRVTVLGSTGSIGRQTLELVERSGGRLEIVALTAGRDVEALAAQARRVRPRALALETAADVAAAQQRLLAAAPGARVEVGPGAAFRVAGEVDAEIVVNGIVGAAGLEPSLAALGRGARLALANKETLVIGAPLIRQALARGGMLVPVDSEHSAALQCLGGRPAREVLRLTITASGGALRDHPDWRRATREEVLAHPVWPMGPRITVDSALMFNKGLELIEAHALFDLGWEQLDAVLHPEARLHAWATFVDGSTVIQAARPDMALPIQLALSWPERWPGGVAPLALEDLQDLTLRPIPRDRYPALELAVEAGRTGGTAPCVLNAADEIAVQAFLDGAIALGDVPEVIARVLGSHVSHEVESVAQLLEVDARARVAARAAVATVAAGERT
jgi:1-deoxy-D-xylulose-5-phosphate reductoisomerase